MGNESEEGNENKGCGSGHGDFQEPFTENVEEGWDEVERRLMTMKKKVKRNSG